MRRSSLSRRWRCWPVSPGSSPGSPSHGWTMYVRVSGVARRTGAPRVACCAPVKPALAPLSALPPSHRHLAGGRPVVQPSQMAPLSVSLFPLYASSLRAVRLEQRAAHPPMAARQTRARLPLVPDRRQASTPPHPPPLFPLQRNTSRRRDALSRRRAKGKRGRVLHTTTTSRLSSSSGSSTVLCCCCCCCTRCWRLGTWR